MIETSALHEYLLRFGDDALLLGHLLSEWAASGPFLEEDLALSNLALDSLGHAQAIYTAASEIDPEGRSVDQLVFFRDASQFKNVVLAEIPVKGDFALTVAKHLLIDNYRLLLFEALCASTYAPLAGIAGKAVKELRYHVRHWESWVSRLGDGTTESRERILGALDRVASFVGELFFEDDLERGLRARGIAVNRADCEEPWKNAVNTALASATLPPLMPKSRSGLAGRNGRHSEYLGHTLAIMQALARAHPNAEW